MQSRPEVEFRNVSISFDGRPALQDISFTLNKGELLLLTGIADAGKSVLLHLAIGLLKPDSGQILVRDQEIDSMDEPDLIAIRGGLMGMVFQEDSLFTGLSVYDNAAYRLEVHGWPPEKVET